jgi:hypothetical protein
METMAIALAAAISGRAVALFVKRRRRRRRVKD